MRLQARPEHSMVLRPNSASESCSLSLEFTQPFDSSVAPSLVIEMANPRILVLFRQALLTAQPMLLAATQDQPQESRKLDGLGCVLLGASVS